MSKILLMEDNTPQALQIIGYLEDANHTVQRSLSATEALVFLENDLFDLIITDVFVKATTGYLPDGGVRLISKIRNPQGNEAAKRHTHCPIMAISGGTDIPGGPSALGVAEQVGADHVLKKPFEEAAFIQAVNRLLAGHRPGKPKPRKTKSKHPTL